MPARVPSLLLDGGNEWPLTGLLIIQRSCTAQQHQQPTPLFKEDPLAHQFRRIYGVRMGKKNKGLSNPLKKGKKKNRTLHRFVSIFSLRKKEKELSRTIVVAGTDQTRSRWKTYKGSILLECIKNRFNSLLCSQRPTLQDALRWLCRLACAYCRTPSHRWLSSDELLLLPSHIVYRVCMYKYIFSCSFNQQIDINISRRREKTSTEWKWKRKREREKGIMGTIYEPWRLPNAPVRPIHRPWCWASTQRFMEMTLFSSASSSSSS